MGQTISHNGSEWAANSKLVIVGGNVGIGSLAPTQTLHIKGSSRLDGPFYDELNSHGIPGEVLSSTGGGVRWASTSSLQGPTGPTGAAGSNGTNGSNGATGATGPTGPLAAGTITIHCVMKMAVMDGQVLQDGLLITSSITMAPT